MGGSELFVTEACEYTNSFLSFIWTIEVILNIEADWYLGFFQGFSQIFAIPSGCLLRIFRQKVF